MVELELIAQGGWVRCTVTFPDADVALATLKRWRAEDEAAGYPYSQIWAEETEDVQGTYPRDRVGALSKGEIALLDYLYPTCEHQMSADLCMGPDHFMTREQEMARGW